MSCYCTYIRLHREWLRTACQLVPIQSFNSSLASLLVHDLETRIFTLNPQTQLNVYEKGYMHICCHLIAIDWHNDNSIYCMSSLRCKLSPCGVRGGREGIRGGRTVGGGGG